MDVIGFMLSDAAHSTKIPKNEKGPIILSNIFNISGHAIETGPLLSFNRGSDCRNHRTLN